MADVVPLHGKAHEQVLLLLPWYVNDTLDAGERARVEAHLADCEACRKDVAAERKLAQSIVTLPVDGEASWQAIKGRISPPRPSSVVPLHRPLYRRRIPIGWAIGGQAAAAAAAVLVVLGVTQQTAAPAYHTLGSRQPTPRGNLLVMFRPTVPEARLRAALTASGARLVDGPTFSGAYVLWVGDAARSDALSRLRRNKDVTLAEPIDPASGS